MASLASGPVVPKPKPYRRFLTSALHSRFVRAALLALVNAFIVTLWTGRLDRFWSWFPLGPAGLTTILFSMSSLFVFILQIATMTVGRQTNVSPYSFVKTILLQSSTYHALFWYVVSAYWFCEVYIWSVPEHKQLGWIVRGDLSTPDRLNERPIYLKFFFISLAFMQSCLHLYRNYSCLNLPVNSPMPASSNDMRTHTIEPMLAQFWKRLPYMGKNAVLLAGANTFAAPFIYKAFFRDSFWQLHLAFAKPFFNLSRSDANPPDTYFIGTILGAAFSVGTLLTFTWQFSAFVFLAFIGQEPLKEGQPLSAASKDPNGTLLNGLSSKRDVVKTFAFWELAVIAQKQPDRRKAIFGDFERSNGPVWTAMHDAALKVISGIDDRILALQPTPTPPTPANQEIAKLPRIAKNPLQQNVFEALPPPSTRTQKVMDFLVVANVKTLGSSKDPWHPPIERTKQQLLEYAKAELEQNKDAVTRFTTSLLTGALGGFFQAQGSAYINGILLGSPTGNAAIIVDAIEAVTKMLVASLSEDDYGKAVQTVPSTVKQFTRTIALMEGFISIHSESLKPRDEAELQEVLAIIERLKESLKELLSAFQLFLNDVGLGIKDLNEARRATEERVLLPRKQEKQSEKAQVRESPSQNEPSSAETNERHERSQIRQPELKQPRRLGPSRRQLNDDRNVFGARDLGTQSSERREMEMVR